MPTFETLPRFEIGWRSLTPEQQAVFRYVVLNAFAPDLTSPDRELRPELRVKPVAGHPDVFEMSWGEYGRAAFSYGGERVPGEPHIVWQQIAIISRLPNASP